MRVEIQVYKDDGELVSTTTGDACRPQDWKTHPERPAIEGEFRFFGFVYQPMVVRQSKVGGF